MGSSELPLSLICEWSHSPSCWSFLHGQTGRSRNWTALGTPGPSNMERLLLLLLLPPLWAGEWAVGTAGPRLGLGLGLGLSLCVPPGPLQKESPYKLQVQGSVTVQEGLCVSVPCKISYPRLDWTDSTRVYGSWFRKEDRSQEDVLMATDNSTRGGKKKRNIPFHLLGDPRANNCSLGIADARKRDSGNYYFQLGREAAEHSYKNNQLTVNVVGTEGSPGAEVREGGKDGPRGPPSLRAVGDSGPSQIRVGTHRGPPWGLASPSLLSSANMDSRCPHQGAPGVRLQQPPQMLPA